jgi:hypothetical protein
MLKTALVLCLSVGLTAPAAIAASSVAEQYARMCGNVLELLPHIVRKSAVAAIGEDAGIVLHPICRGVQMTTFGNAGGLTRTIARNPTLTAVLADAGWRPDDVIGIQISGERVDLYVHRDP